MAARYIISDYGTGENSTPSISCRTGDLTQAKATFDACAERRVLSVVLYDTQTDTVIKIAINGEPIYLVKCIERARNELEQNAIVNDFHKRALITAAQLVIGQIIQALTGTDFSALFLVPYYVIKGDVAEAVGAGAGVVGGMAGAKFAEKYFGPEWRPVGAVIGTIAAGSGAYKLVQSLSPPSPKCTFCRGAGLVLDLRRCTNCKGKGYRK